MSSNRKIGFLFGGAAVLFLTLTVISCLRLRLYPSEEYRQPTVISEASDASENETFAFSETDSGTVSEPALPAASDTVLRELYRQHEKTVSRLQLVLSLSPLLFAACMVFLLLFAKRSACAEGIETDLAGIAAAAAVFSAQLRVFAGYTNVFRVDPAGKISIEGTLSALDVLLAFTVSLCLTWCLWSLLSWILRSVPAGWCLLYRITELLSADKNGLSLMVMLPSGCACACIAAAAGCAVSVRSASREIVIGLLLCEALVFLIVLADRTRTIRDKQQQLIEEARVSERMRVDLIANVSHDLRTPLSAVIGYGELLEKEALSEDGRQNLEKLHQKSVYLLEMVNAVFDLAKVSSGVTKCRRDELDLICLLEQTVADHEDALKAKEFELRRHYEENPLPIVSDGIFLHQIFSNLISNAIKYTLTGTRIHLQVKRSEDAVVIRMINVASYEMNFTEKEILERFSRGDASRSTEGSGLGLAIAKTYTEALSGEFHVKVDGDQFIAEVRLPASVRES